jgi:phospholipase D1/2
MAAEESGTGILRQGDTCWRIERADRLALIVDAAAYFRHLRQTLLAAREEVHLIGWDFDLRIEMVPGESDEEGRAPDGWPNTLGEFLQAVVEARPGLHLRILKWDGAMIAAIAQQARETLKLKLASDRIRFALDSHHPASACHHQKIVVVDDRMAFCGGIDVTTGRWDTRDHAPGDDRRTDPDGSIHQPWHDVTTALEGPAAAALGDLARMRWRAATGEELEPPAPAPSPWPDDLEADLEGIEVGIARTAPRYHGRELVNEIERLYLAAIRGARRTLYIESQYLSAGTLCEAMEARLREPDGPEILVVNPRNAQSFMEDEAMHSVRARMIERLRDAAGQGGGRFRIFHPANAEGEPIYVHAKVLAMDDRLLRIGSSNIDNRSMGFDTECDVAFEARTEAARGCVRAIVLSLLGEHLDVAPEEVGREWDARGSLLDAVEALRRDEGRSLRPIEPEPLDPLEYAFAESRLADPRYWPRNRPHPKDRVKHTVRRAVAPYHVEAVGIGAVALAVGALLLGSWAGRELSRRRARRRLPAPMVVTDGRVRPPLRPRPEPGPGPRPLR